MLCEHCGHEYYEIDATGITCGECSSMLYEFDYDERVARACSQMDSRHLASNEEIGGSSPSTPI